MECTTLCAKEYEAFRRQMNSYPSRACGLVVPVLFLAALVLGILGMIYMPQHVNGFAVVFCLGLCGTILTVVYASIITIGSCVEPVLPLTSKGLVRVTAAAA